MYCVLFSAYHMKDNPHSCGINFRVGPGDKYWGVLDILHHFRTNYYQIWLIKLFPEAQNLAKTSWDTRILYENLLYTRPLEWPPSMTDNFGHNIGKRQIGHRKSHVAPSYKAGNGPTQAPRTLKYVQKPKGSPYMRETVENGWLRQVTMTTNNFIIN